MKPRLSSARPGVTRTSRFDPRGAALESVAAEFALLAQRRARAARQVDLLGRQLSAAQLGLDTIQSRMAMLAGRIDGIDPGLRGPAEIPPPPPPPAPPSITFRPAQYRPAPSHYAAPPPEPAHAPAQATQPHGAGRKTVLIPAKRQLARRRPFLPE